MVHDQNPMKKPTCMHSHSQSPLSLTDRVSFARSVILSFLLTFSSGCVGKTVRPTSADDLENQAVTQKQLESYKTLMTELSAKIEVLEGKLSQYGVKIEQNRTAIEQIQKAPTMPTTIISSSGSHSAVDRVGLPMGNAASGDIRHEDRKTSGSAGSTQGFVQDAATTLYRKGMIEFDSKKLAESILTFTEFLEQFPDHPYAGSAQFRIAEAYLVQKEYKLALSEYQRVMTSYDRSPKTADTLSRILEIAGILKMPELAEKSKQTLHSLFAGSPAAERRLQSVIPPTQNQDSELTASNQPHTESPQVPTAPDPTLDSLRPQPARQEQSHP